MRSKLDVINDALSAVGLSRVASLDSRYPAFVKALGVYERVSHNVQLRGWWFNRSEVTLNPDLQGRILVPSKAAAVKPCSPRYVLRDRFLYDKEERTNVIGKSVACVIIEVLEYEDIPPDAAAYIAARTVFEHFLDEEGSEPKLTRYERAAMGAWAALRQEELKHEKPNVLESLSIRGMTRSYGQKLRVR